MREATLATLGYLRRVAPELRTPRNQGGSARAESVEALTLLTTGGVPLPADIASHTCRGDSLRCLRHVHDLGSPIAGAMTHAVGAHALECIAYLAAHGVQPNRADFTAAACRIGPRCAQTLQRLVELGAVPHPSQASSRMRSLRGAALLPLASDNNRRRPGPCPGSWLWSHAMLILGA